MTTCQRCAGNLQYQIMAYDGDSNLVGTIDKTCEPCINRTVRLLEIDAETQTLLATRGDPLAAARGIKWGLILSTLPWLAIVGIVIGIYYGTH